MNGDEWTSMDGRLWTDVGWNGDGCRTKRGRKSNGGDVMDKCQAATWCYRFATMVGNNMMDATLQVMALKLATDAAL
jgi:hypothetical protein